MMLLPSVVKLPLSAAPRSVSSPNQEIARANVRPPVALSAPPSVQAGSGDLAAQIKARLEQDLDYQILRKSFALDAGDESRRASDGASAARVDPHAGAAFAGGRSAVLEARMGDGSIATANLELQVSWSQASSTRFELDTSSLDSSLTLQFQSARRQTFQMDLRSSETAAVQMGDPLVLDLSGRGIATTGVEAGVQFDLTGDGQVEQVSFVTGDSWFLALDRNGNGQIDNGLELFGDQGGAAHGFAELARYDGNADGVIDAGDEVFSQLRLFQIGSDGAQTLKTLEAAEVTAIELGYQNTRKALNLYDSVAQVGQFQRADGSTGEASDVLLGYRALA
ncbi:hypothetical protein [Thiocystis violascens]|nr:hypothetical protein [Thiocystis violascens]